MSMSESEWQRVVVEFNATHAPYPHDALIHELLERQAERTPQATAVKYDGQRLTYRELNRYANQLAQHLREQGVQIGEHVPILIPRSLPMLVAQLAVLKCGAAYVPLDPTQPGERQSFMLRDCAARRIIVERKTGDTPEWHDLQWIESAAVTDAERSVGNVLLQRSSSHPAYVMYTSGSTGTPKGAVVPHRAVNRLVINNPYARIEPTDCIAHCSNPAFDASTFEIWGALLNGASVLIVPQSILMEGRKFCELMQQHEVSVLFLTAGLFKQQMQVLAGAFGRLKYLLSGGDVADPRAFAWVLKNSPPRHLLNAYGPTECTTFSTTHLVEAVEDETQSLPIGRPIANTTAYILDADLQPLPIGVTGEIFIGGPGVALGYLNRPELTAERFIPDPFSKDPQARLYRTGDLGCWRADGAIEYKGRNDLQVKIRGFRVELAEIEGHLATLPGVRDAAVVLREDAPGERRLVAYLTSANGATLSAAVLRAHLVSRLPEYMVPVAYVVLRDLPLNANGKVDRRALPKPDASALVTREYEAPRGEVEELLARVWSELLGVPKVSRHDDFFELGGDSMLSMKMIARVADLSGLQLSFAAVFECPTIGQMAECVEAGSGGAT